MATSNLDLENLIYLPRQSLMEDITRIIDSNFGEVEYKDDVIKQLRNAVYLNFPT